MEDISASLTSKDFSIIAGGVFGGILLVTLIICTFAFWIPAAQERARLERERIATEQAEQAEQERQRIAADREREEQRQQEDQERQRIAAEQREREDQERMRLARERLATEQREQEAVS